MHEKSRKNALKCLNLFVSRVEAGHNFPRMQQYHTHFSISVMVFSFLLEKCTLFNWTWFESCWKWFPQHLFNVQCTVRLIHWSRVATTIRYNGRSHFWRSAFAVNVTSSYHCRWLMTALVLPPVSHKCFVNINIVQCMDQFGRLYLNSWKPFFMHD